MIEFSLQFGLIFIFFATALFRYGDRDLFALGSVSNTVALKFFVFPTILYGLLYIGFRPLDAGTDTPIYVYTYENLDGLLNSFVNGVAIYGNTELLWWPMQGVLSYFLNSREWLVALFFINTLALYQLYKFLGERYQASSYLFCFAFLTYFFVYMGNGIRQSLSLPISIVGVFLFFEKRWWPAFLFFLVGVGLHWSSLVLIGLPVLGLKIFRKKWLFMAMPVLALLFSGLMDGATDFLIQEMGLVSLEAKRDLYFAVDRVSHVEFVWKTVNFWICLTFGYLYLMFSRFDEDDSIFLHAVICFFLSLILFGIGNVDFSERYMPPLLLLLPLMFYGVLRNLVSGVFYRNVIFLLVFYFMGVAVFFAESSRVTLGYFLE